MPIPKIDCEKREEDDMFSGIKHVLTRIENWLKSKNVVTPKLSEKSSKSKSKKTFQKQKAVTNQSVPSPITRSDEIEVEEIP